MSKASPCCIEPIDVVMLQGQKTLLRVAACTIVPPECADRHGHGFMDPNLRVFAGPQAEVIVVEGGCEMRATMHGYVPPGVEAWSGCVHKRYTWDGTDFVKR